MHLSLSICFCVMIKKPLSVTSTNSYYNVANFTTICLVLNAFLIICSLLVCSIINYGSNRQGEVTPIDSVLTPATAVKNFDLNLGP